jgi:hypothetical protein
LRLTAWTEVLVGNPDGPMILGWLDGGVPYEAFAQPFRGRFAGTAYNDSVSLPPPRIIPNRESLYDTAHIDFVRTEIRNGTRSGGMLCLGPIGSTPPPTVVCPLGVEPKKPRLIYDARYINLWQRAPPFAFDSLSDLARAASADSLLSVWDHKSGYFHIRLHPDSRQYFGFEFEGHYYVYTVLPFGWNVSPFVYQTVSRAVSFYLRRMGIPDFIYLDDSATVSRPTVAMSHSFIKAMLLTYLGYYVHLGKTALVPKPQQQWLGFIVDLSARTFRVPEAKLQHILHLLDTSLAQANLEVASLRSLTGKLVSLAPAVPGALLYTRHLFDALALADRQGVHLVPVTPTLREELTRWLTLRSWHGTRVWHNERHVHVRLDMATDASGHAWGGWFRLPGGSTSDTLVGDVWTDEEMGLDIGTKEMLASVRTIACLPPDLRDCIIFLEGDNSAMISLLKGGRAARGADLNRALKELFHLTLNRNLIIDASWLRSEDNVVPDAISRQSVWGEGRLRKDIFCRLSELVGGFSLDAMASATSAHCPRFISRYLTPGCAGADVFAHRLSQESAVYAFPPPAVCGAFLAFMKEERAFGVVVVENRPNEPWWPLLRTTPIPLADAGDVSAVSYPGLGPIKARFALAAFVCDFRRGS